MLSELYHQRRRQAWRQHYRYGRLLFNSHFCLFLVFAGVSAVLALRELLRHPEAQHWLPWARWALVVSAAGLQWRWTAVTWRFVAADRLFLFATDGILWQAYCQQAFWYSWWRTIGCWVGLGSIVVALGSGDHATPWWCYAGLWLLVGISQLYRLTRQRQALIRQHLSDDWALDWPYALQTSQRQAARLARWYRLVADVSRMPQPVRQRRWLVRCLQPLQRQQRGVTWQICVTAVRQPEFLGMMLRLLIVSGILAWYVQKLAGWAWVLVPVAVTYLLQLQWQAVDQRTQAVRWSQIYPWTAADHQRSRRFLLLATAVMLLCCDGVVVLLAIVL